MARKDASIGFDRVIGNIKADIEDTQKEKVNKVAAESKTRKQDPKPRKQRQKAVEGKDYVVFTARVTPEAADFIRNYAFTKRMSIQQAIDDIVFDYKKRYEKNPKNEKLIEKDR